MCELAFLGMPCTVSSWHADIPASDSVDCFDAFERECGEGIASRESCRSCLNSCPCSGVHAFLHLRMLVTLLRHGLRFGKAVYDALNMTLPCPFPPPLTTISNNSRHSCAWMAPTCRLAFTLVKWWPTTSPHAGGGRYSACLSPWCARCRCAQGVTSVHGS